MAKRNPSKVKRDWYDMLTLIISFFTLIALITGLFMVHEFSINLKELIADTVNAKNITAEKIIINNTSGNGSSCIYSNGTYSFIISSECP